MNTYENFTTPTQNAQDNLLAECKEKLLEALEKSKKLDGFHKKQLYEWCCKNAAISSISDLQK